MISASTFSVFYGVFKVLFRFNQLITRGKRISIPSSSAVDNHFFTDIFLETISNLYQQLLECALRFCSDQITNCGTFPFLISRLKIRHKRKMNFVADHLASNNQICVTFDYVTARISGVVSIITTVSNSARAYTTLTMNGNH